MNAIFADNNAIFRNMIHNMQLTRLLDSFQWFPSANVRSSSLLFSFPNGVWHFPKSISLVLLGALNLLSKNNNGMVDY